MTKPPFRRLRLGNFTEISMAPRPNDTPVRRTTRHVYGATSAHHIHVHIAGARAPQPERPTLPSCEPPGRRTRRHAPLPQPYTIASTTHGSQSNGVSIHAGGRAGGRAGVRACGRAGNEACICTCVEACVEKSVQTCAQTCVKDMMCRGVG